MMIVLLAFTYCSGEKENQNAKVGKLSLLQLAQTGQVPQSSETKPATQKIPTNLKVRKSSDSSARTESANQEYTTTGSNSEIGGKIFSVLEFGQGESLEISYFPQYDEKGALKSVSSESIAYKDSFGTQVPAISCDVNSENELNCLFGTNTRSVATAPFTLTVLQAENPQSNSKGSIDSTDLKVSSDKTKKNIANTFNYSQTRPSARNYTPLQWYLAALWWDCHFGHNVHSCNQLNNIVNSYCADSCKFTQVCNGLTPCQCFNICTRCDGSTYVKENYGTCY